MLKSSVTDVIDYFAGDPHTRSIILYVEAFTRPRLVLVVKSGRFAESPKGTASFTQAMEGGDFVYRATLKSAGIERAFDIGEFFHTAEFLSLHAPQRQPRLAIATSNGGPGVIATDALNDRQGELAHVYVDTVRIPNQALPSSWPCGNPVDFPKGATVEQITKAPKLALADDVLVCLNPQAITDPMTVDMEAGNPMLAESIAGQIGGGRQGFWGGRRETPFLIPETRRASLHGPDVICRC